VLLPLSGFAGGCLRTSFLLLPFIALGLSGCAAMSRDVHQYYRQMALNYKEAEEKAKLNALSRETEANMLLQAGDVHKYKRAQKEVTRLKDWQSHCARQRERFEKAADKMEHTGDSKQEPALDAETSSHSRPISARIESSAA
jgi:hypothetical protein